jgi:hypothetical protein
MAGGNAMILRRLTTSLKQQHWMTIAIELVIVIVGVFIGTWVANRNQEAVERRSAEQMVTEVRPGLALFELALASAQDYLATATQYGNIAFAGWAGNPKVSDERFVISAYQASQITQIAMNGASWTQIYGGAKLSQLSDPELRTDLAGVMALDFGQLSLNNIATPYRQHVREIIPQDIQDAIRAHCGDITVKGTAIVTLLPATCDVHFPAERWASAARDLRSEPQLVKELRWHRAAVASFVFVLGIFRQRVQRALDRIDADSKKRY